MAYNSLLGYDPDIKDYSALIANTTDAAQKQELLTQRQNKIDDQGIIDVPPNALVSTWSSGFTPGGWDDAAGSYSPIVAAQTQTSGLSAYAPGSSLGQSAQGIDLAGLYSAVEAQKVKALTAARQSNQLGLEAQLPTIESQYDSLNANLQKNAALTALGDAEKLAVLGLGGNAYAAPQSGYSETARVSLDNAVRSDVNANEQARVSAKNTIANAILANNYATDVEIANSIAELTLKSLVDARTQLESDRNYGLALAGLMGNLNGTATIEGTAQNLKHSENEYKNALERWKTSGRVLPADAAILGVQAGTPTSDETFRLAQLELARLSGKG